MTRHVDKLRARFQQLRYARDSGSIKRPEQLWEVWKVQIETWSHEYWLLKLELQQIRRDRERQS